MLLQMLINHLMLTLYDDKKTLLAGGTYSEVVLGLTVRPYNTNLIQAFSLPFIN